MAKGRYDFGGQHFVVTGGAQGIGFEIVKKFLEAGAHITLWDYSTTALELARTELESFREHLHLRKVNVADHTDCLAAASELARPIDGVINNAGITRDKSLAKMAVSDFEAVIDTNLGGVFHVTQALLSKFKTDSKHLRIVNISSVVALYGNFGQTNYVASKAGVIGMTKTWARELGRKGFTVNAIAPGFIETAMTQAMPSDVLTQMAAKVPLAKLGSPVDIARACLFLCSEDAAYINGAVLSVDGGLVC
jgi:3-oxoacyl-[acyl-carrier protein] reductase